MASKDPSHRSGRPPAWFLVTLGAGAASGIAWLVARYRRDRLVAEAGAVAHPHDDAAAGSGADAAVERGETDGARVAGDSTAVDGSGAASTDSNGEGSGRHAAGQPE